MSYDAIDWAMKQRGVSSTQQLVLLHLADHLNGKTGQCNPSHATLAKECVLAPRTVLGAIKGLEKAGLLRSVHRFSAPKDANTMRSQLSSQYVLQMQSGAKSAVGVKQDLQGGYAANAGGVMHELRTNQEVETGKETLGVSVFSRSRIPSSRKVISEDTLAAFDKFWSAYPNKTAKDLTLKNFVAANATVHIDSILSDIKKRKLSAAWEKNDGQYIPNPHNYISQRKWEDKMDEKFNIFAGAR